MNLGRTQYSPWDYTSLAQSYEKRADYAIETIGHIVSALDIQHRENRRRAIDIGAGTGKLTRLLLSSSFDVVAIEPNGRMFDVANTIAANSTATWVRAKAEAIPFAQSSFDLTCFGSSFNVVDPQIALTEVERVLHEEGRLAILWNHRETGDPLQRRIEEAIRTALPEYSPDPRRQNPLPEVETHGAFSLSASYRLPFVHTTSREDFVAAWRSHGTLARAAGSRFDEVVDAIASLVTENEVSVPFATSLWVFHKRKSIR